MAHYRAEVLADSPVAYWRFGETAGTAAEDESANNQDGSYNNGVGLGVTSLLAATVNSAVNLDGSNDWIDLGTPYGSAASVYSAEIWYTHDADPTNDAILIGHTESGLANRVLRVLMLASGIVRADIECTGSVTARAESSALVDGTTYHVVVVGDNGGAAGAGRCRLFVDKVLVATAEQAGQTILAMGTSMLWGVSKRDGAVANRLNGKVDEAALYDTALSTTRIDVHYDVGLHGFEETNRTVGVAATVTGTDGRRFPETDRDVVATATVTELDAPKLVETNRDVAATATVAAVDTYIPTALGSYSAEVLADNPRQWLRLSETTGTAAADSSGAGRDGVYGSGVAKDKAGLIAGGDRSVEVPSGDVTTNWVDLGTPLQSGITTYTAEIWFEAPAVPTADKGLLGQVTHLGPQARLLVTPAGKLRADVLGANGDRGVMLSAVLTVGAVYHTVGVFDADGGGFARVTLYLNGVSVGSDLSTGQAVDLDSSLGWGIGRRDSGEYGIGGRVDEAALYPTVLSAARVATHYAAGISTVLDETRRDVTAAATVETGGVHRHNETARTVTVDATIEVLAGIARSEVVSLAAAATVVATDAIAAAPPYSVAVLVDAPYAYYKLDDVQIVEQLQVGAVATVGVSDQHDVGTPGVGEIVTVPVAATVGRVDAAKRVELGRSVTVAAAVSHTDVHNQVGGQTLLWANDFAARGHNVTYDQAAMTADAASYPVTVQYWTHQNGRARSWSYNGQKCMRIEHPPNTTTGTPAGYIVFDSWSVDHAIFEYDLLFWPSFDFSPAGGKMTGVTIIKPSHDFSIGCKPGSEVLTSGGQALNMWRRASPVAVDHGRIEMYIYHVDKTDSCGDSELAVNSRLNRDQWHTIRNEYVLNTPGQRNGIQRLWVDGVLQKQKTNIMWRDTNQTVIKRIQFRMNFGGNETHPQFFHAQTEYTYYTNFKFWSVA